MATSAANATRQIAAALPSERAEWSV